jgi:hypothetical protein
VGDWSKVQPDGDSGEHHENHCKDDDVTNDFPGRHAITFTKAPTIVSDQRVMGSDTAGPAPFQPFPITGGYLRSHPCALSVCFANAAAARTPLHAPSNDRGRPEIAQQDS